jgi:hypothetical protein
MKKVLYFAAMLLTMTLTTSCEKEEVGNTATVATAGQWYVTVDAVDESGNVVYEDADLFGLGRVLLLTANTAANSATEMIVDDLQNFWGYRVKVTVDPVNMTFATNTTENNNLNGDDINVTITGGKIVKDGGVQNNGSKADYIEFYVNFSDDQYPAAYGYAKYHVYGIRYSGLAEND